MIDLAAAAGILLASVGVGALIGALLCKSIKRTK
jgi:hypothetical protein